VTRLRRTSKRGASSPKTGSLDDLRDELPAADPKFRKLWAASAPKRVVAIALEFLIPGADLKVIRLAPGIAGVVVSIEPHHRYTESPVFQSEA